MPFVQSAESLKSKMHASSVSTPVLLGLLVLAALALILVVQNVIGAVGGHDFTISKSSTQQQGSSSGAADDSSTAAGASSQSVEQVVVHVSGAVSAPGVYSLAKGSRVQDAVNAAGGFTADAATDASNLARQLVDGEQVKIATRDSAAAAGTSTGGTAVVSQGSSAAASQTGPVNINTATSEQLQTLPGVGAATAQKIIANRQDEGPFQKKEDLKRVSGIGDKKYEALADLITVG